MIFLTQGSNPGPLHWWMDFFTSKPPGKPTHIFESESESEVAQPCLTLCDPMDCSLPDSSVYGVFQARILEWVAISFSRRFSQPRDWTQVSHIVGRCFVSEPPGKLHIYLGSVKYSLGTIWPPVENHRFKYFPRPNHLGISINFVNSLSHVWFVTLRTRGWWFGKLSIFPYGRWN